MKHDMSETEFLILQYLWESDGPRSFSDIMVHFNSVENKEWKKQTVNTFLTRLTQKGYLIVNKETTKARYAPSLTREEYYHEYTKKIVDVFFQGSIKSFLCAFTGDHELTEEEKKELLEFLLSA